MKKMSEKSFRILKVFVLLVVLTACGLYYVLFVDAEMPKTMETTSKETTSMVADKIVKETTTSDNAFLEEDTEEFIIEIEPIDDYVASESTTFLQKDDKKEKVDSVSADGKININTASSE
ncbi:MAG: hypothetical protein MJ151_03950, partial [Lachnospiraceae bacterium]|nr:hypothetical protein [Lachnospiraceae bacterium]